MHPERGVYDRSSCVRENGIETEKLLANLILFDFELAGMSYQLSSIELVLEKREDGHKCECADGDEINEHQCYRSDSSLSESAKVDVEPEANER